MERYRCGWTSKICIALNGLGRPVKLVITPGQRCDAPLAPALLEGLSTRRELANKAYDSNALGNLIVASGAEALIPRNPTREHAILCDFEAYKVRNAVEGFTLKLGQFRRIETRFYRGVLHFLCSVQIAAVFLWIR